jgi:hypothetical protein
VARDQILTPALRSAILKLAARPDINSISCPLDDFELWKGLLTEQVKRARRHGSSPQEALYLVGPDSGIPGITGLRSGFEDDETPPQPPEPDASGNFAPHRWGGEVHIPFEGTPGGDLFILPAWHNVFPENLAQPYARFHWLVRKPCNHLLTDRDLGDLAHSTRTECANWWLYKSQTPLADCRSYEMAAFDIRSPNQGLVN